MANPALLGAYWFGLQIVWGAILAVSLQARTIELARGDAIAAYGWIAGLGAALAALVQFFAGRWADARVRRTGHRHEFYLAGTAVAIAALLWFYTAPSFAALVAAFFALQFGMNVATGPYQAVIPDHIADERRGTASAWMAAFQFLGNSAGLLVAGFVLQNLRVALVLCAALSISFAITFAHAARLRSRVQPQALSIGRPFLTLLISRGLINTGFYTLMGFLLFFVRDSLGIAGEAVKITTALLFISFTCAGVAGAALAARPADRLDRRLVVSGANVVIAAALVLLAGAQGPGAAYAAAVAAGVAWGAFTVADWALACAVLPPGAMATAMGVWNIANTVPQILAPALTAPLLLALNARSPGLGPRAAFVLVIVEFTLGTLWLWRLPARFALPQSENGAAMQGRKRYRAV